VADDPARRAAVDVVLAVENNDAYANLLLPRVLRERHLSGVGAGFATELAYGTLRWQGTLDAVIAHAAGRDVLALDPTVRAALRVGAYQLLHMRVPSHAGVSTTVDLARAVAGPRPAGLVNAVMRRVSEREWPAWVDVLTAQSDPVARLAFEHGHPDWVARAFLDALGGDLAELAAALGADRPSTHLMARPGLVSREALLASTGGSAAPGRFSRYAVRLAGGDPGRLAPVRDGRARVQDEGSQLVALALAGATPEGVDRRWLDLCAGPGGKSSLLAGLLPQGARLVAADIRPHRAALVVRGVAGTPTDIVVADGTAPAWPAGCFDRVLADVPCTGLGALRRRPEVRWRRRPEDVDLLRPVQEALLHTAIDSLRVGGVAVYSTCSPHLGETVDVVRAVTRSRDDVDVLDARTLLPDVPGVGDGPFAQLWPHRHGTDAMFVAALRRANSPR
jgi:16S rRNA (cytosine967-C5)-methyltransferase